MRSIVAHHVEIATMLSRVEIREKEQIYKIYKLAVNLQVKGDIYMDSKKKNRKDMILEYKERPITGGVYKITNIANRKYILVADIDLQSAKNRFDFSVKYDSVVLLKLAKDWKEYGGNQFTFEILEEIEMKDSQGRKDFKEDLKILKNMWSERYDSTKSY